MFEKYFYTTYFSLINLDMLVMAGVAKNGVLLEKWEWWVALALPKRHNRRRRNRHNILVELAGSCYFGACPGYVVGANKDAVYNIKVGRLAIMVFAGWVT